MASYEAVLFDFDGVLVNSEPVHFDCWQQILRPFDITLDWDYYCANCIGIADRAMLATLCSRKDPPLDIELLLAEYPRKKELFRDTMLQNYAFDECIVSLLDDLRSNYKLAVVTSSGRREVEPILQNAGILNLFETCVYGSDVQRLKPAPEPYLLAAERLNVTNALVIEDSVAGIAAGKAAGFKVVEIPEQTRVCSLVREALSNTVL